MSDEREVIVKCPNCAELFTARFSPYAPDTFTPCPACGKEMPIEPSMVPPPIPPSSASPPSSVFCSPPPIPPPSVVSSPSSVVSTLSSASRPPPPAKRTSGLAIAGMILGIVSIVPCVACGGPFFAVIGLVLSIQALYTIRRQPQELEGRGMAIAGIATSIIGLLLGLIIILLFTFFSSALRPALRPDFWPIEKPLPP